MTQQGDIIEIKIYDATYRIFFKGKARISNRSQMAALGDELKTKGVNLSSSGWFD